MTALPIRYNAKSAFHRALHARVAEYFAATGLKRRGLIGMYVKAATVLAWLGASYALLVFVATTWWHVVLLGVSLAFALAGVGFNVPHDAGHGGFSGSRLLNGLAKRSFDLIGGSSYLWYWRHNILHHNYTNIAGADDDISVGPLGRLSPAQPRHAAHRYQHVYMWVLYGFVAFKWQLVDDFVEMVRGRIASHPIPRPAARDLTVFALGKLVFLALVFVLPAFLHPFSTVVLVYAAIGLATGVIIGVVFQLAHCLEEADFPTVPGANRLETDWATHQVQTTVDFARTNRLLTWYVGGLNFQIEHHLFPSICHLHYPALAPIVERTCREFGVRYTAHETIGAALRSHTRWLKRLGASEAFAPARLSSGET